MSRMICYVRLREDNRVTIPIEVREALKLVSGDILELTVEKYLDVRK